MHFFFQKRNWLCVWASKNHTTCCFFLHLKNLILQASETDTEMSSRKYNGVPRILKVGLCVNTQDPLLRRTKTMSNQEPVSILLCSFLVMSIPSLIDVFTNHISFLNEQIGSSYSKKYYNPTFNWINLNWGKRKVCKL